MRAGVSSTALFFSITLPDTGQYSSLAALTLSSAPHSPVKHQRIRKYHNNKYHCGTVFFQHFDMQCSNFLGE